MILISGGVARIGATDLGGYSFLVQEIPMQPFYLDVTEVTASAYSVCVDRGVCHLPESSGPYDGSTWEKRATQPRLPLTGVNSGQAVDYCKFVGKRLPTEEEWEYAARGTDFRLYPWGNQEPGDGLVCTKRDPVSGEHLLCDVGTVPGDRSPFGVLDMDGNVAEWVDSTGGFNCRGESVPDGIRTARAYACSRTSSKWVGFRCALTPAGVPPSPRARRYTN